MKAEQQAEGLAKWQAQSDELLANSKELTEVVDIVARAALEDLIYMDSHRSNLPLLGFGLMSMKCVWLDVDLG